MITLIVKDLWVPEQFQGWTPRSGLGKYVRDLLHYLPAEAAAELVSRISSCTIVESELWVKVFRRNGEVEDWGMVGNKVVTDAGVGYIVDAFQNLVEVENQKYHALGTGVTAEAASQTTLVTELTTEYTGNVRATGTTTETAANIYSTVATNTLDGTPAAALREHGIFSASTVGVLLDRTLFDAITLVSGDGFQSTYNLTFTAGG